MKKQRTRKERTLRRLAVLGLCLLFMGSQYGLTPKAAVRMGETRYNTGPTTLIRETTEFPVEMDEPTRLCLSVNDRALMFTVAEFELWGGWHETQCDVLVRDGERGANAGLYSHWGAWDIVWYLFGYVNDPAAMTLRVRLGNWQKIPGSPGFVGDMGKEEWVEVKTLDIPRSQWFHAEGGTYFILPVFTTEEVAGFQGRMEAYVDLLDQKGQALDSLGPI